MIHIYMIEIVRDFDKPLHNKGGIHWGFYVKQASKDVMFEDIEISLGSI